MKKCAGFKTREGKKNPDCDPTFWVENNNFEKKKLCKSCQRLKNNVYHCEYTRKWRKKNNK